MKALARAIGTALARVRPAPATRAARTWVRERKAEDNTPAALGTLLLQLGVPVAHAALRRQLVTHPAYPSLQAVADCLDDRGISTRAVQAGIEQLESIEYPVLAHVSSGADGRFVVLTACRAGSVRYLDPAAGWMNESAEDFARCGWRGILLLPALRPGAAARRGDPESRAARLEASRVPLLAGLAGLAVALLFLTCPPVPPAVGALWLGWGGLKLAGLLVCALLVAISSGHREAPALRLCPAGGAFSCQSVLGSPAAKLGGWLPLADLGLLYFLGGLLALGLGGLCGSTAATAGALALLNLLALPYTFFSIGYQATLRTWCWLCLTVQALLWGECGFALAASGLSLPRLLAQPWAPTVLPVLALSYGVPALLWGLLKPVVLRGLRADLWEEEAIRLRRSPHLLQQALQREPQIAIEALPHEISVGAESAPLRLTVVAHPLCGACAAVHAQLEPLLASARELLRCDFRLAAAGGGAKTAVARRLTEFAVAGQSQAAHEALGAWFADPGQALEPWLERFQLASPPDAAEVSRALDAMLQWIRAAHVDLTPTLFLNGVRLPPAFGIPEIKLVPRAQLRAAATARKQAAA